MATRRRGRPRKNPVRIQKTRIVGLVPRVETYWLISCSECGRIREFKRPNAKTCSARCRKARERRLAALALAPLPSMPASRCYRDYAGA